MPGKRPLLKKTFIGLACIVIAAGVLAGGVRLADMLAPQYRQALAQRLGERIDADVTVGGLELHWRWSGPVLRLQDVAIKKPEAAQPALRMAGLGLHFSFRDLARGERMPNGLRIHEPRLAVVVNGTRGLALAHWPVAQPGGEFDWERVAQLRDALDFIDVHDARIDILSPSLPQGQARINALDATLRDDDRTLTATLSARAEGWLDSLQIEADITGALPDFATARVTLAADQIDTLDTLRALGLWNETALSLAGGRADIDLAARWTQQHFDTGSARLSADEIQAADLDEPVLPALTATFTAGRAATGNDAIHVSLDSLSGALSGIDDIHASARLDPRARTATVHARQLPAALVAPWARLRFDALAEAKLRGTIDDVEIALTPDAPPRLAVAFRQLAIDAPALAAGPVSGHYYRQAAENVLTFTGAGGALRIDHYLRGSLPVTDLKGELAWHATDSGRQIRIRDLKVTSGQAAATANGSVSLSGTRAPVADLRATLEAPDVTELLAHIPQAHDLPNERLRDWLPKAIKAGRVESAEIELAGPLDDFPFANGGGRFTVDVRGSGVDLAYKPEWPPLTGVSGRFTLNGDTLTVTAPQGKILGVAVGPANARIDNVREPVLFLDGAVNDASANRMLSFLTASPLNDKFGKLVREIDVGGVADLGIELRVPLKPGLGDLKTSGVIETRGNTLTHGVLPAPIEAIDGRITFDDTGLSADNLRGQLMGLDLNADLEPAADGKLSIVAHTRLALPEHRDFLAHYVPAPWLAYARGSTPARVSLSIATDGRVSDLLVRSPLAGMALDLPAPLFKQAQRPAGLTVSIDGDDVMLDYGEKLRLDMAFDEGRLWRAAALFGAARSPAPNAPGLWLGGHIKRLDLSGWFDLFNAVRTPDAGPAPRQRGAGLDFRGADVRVDDLRAGPRQLRDVELRALPITQGDGWHFYVEGPDARGQATWEQRSDGRNALSAQFSRLALHTVTPIDRPSAAGDNAGRSNQGHGSRILTDWSPATLPIMDIDIASLSVEATDFGTAAVDAVALPNGWRLDRAQLTGGELRLETNGYWSVSAGQTQAALDAYVQGRGLANLMQTLGYSATIEAETASLRTHLEIGPTDNGLDLYALDGELQLRLDDGTLLSIEPGAGRALGLLNLYVLPRRIMLDFRDVVDEGLAFDNIDGTFDIRQGNAYTDNLAIETPSSVISIDGRIGLAARDYDETVTIVPKFGGGVTLAGTVLGGPVVGAAVFAIQELLKRPIQDASSVSYKLQGSWDDPQIVEPRASE